MARTVYLLRHCEPELPAEGPVCLGATDVPLSALGRMRAALLAETLPEVTRVFTSPLCRARETAEALGRGAETVEDLRELGMGCWEGLSFDEIRRRFPALYEKRGREPFTCFPEGGEAPADCRRRARTALEECLGRSSGDIAVVAHAGVNRLLLCALSGRDGNEFWRLPQPLGCVSTLRLDGSAWTIERLAALPDPPPLTPELCERLLDAAGTPEPVRAHARAVAARAEELAAALKEHGYALDAALLRAAALLHDVARTETEHARTGAAWLRALGYPRAAEAVESHHELSPEHERLPDEAAVLYLADKQTRGTERVTLEARFASSYEKCKTDEARENHARRFAQAKRVERMLGRALRGE